MAGGSSRRVFGQAMGGGSRYQRQMGHGHSKREREKSEQELQAQRRAEYRRKRHAQGEEIDVKFGYSRFDYKSATQDETRRGWLFNMLPTTLSTVDHGGDGETTSAGPERSGLDLYFRTESGSTFKSTVLYDPYFYVIPLAEGDSDHAMLFEALTSVLLRSYEGLGLQQVEVVYMQDLDKPNHLSPKFRQGFPMLKLVFSNVQQLMEVRRQVRELVQKNQKRQQERSLYFEETESAASDLSVLDTLVDIREYDVPYLVRVCTDLNIRAGAWYTVTPNPHDSGVTLSDQDVETKANPSFLAFDIECTKAPLKFPDASVDSIFMISYMVDGQGYLILSRHVVSQDVQDFEYTPKPTYPGPFHIFNEPTEKALLERFFAEYQKHSPQIVVTYNGDFFDWPYVEKRAALYGMDIYTELGVEQINDGEYRGRCSVHLDAFHWVQRDSYLPQGAQGLKAVTKYKLGYDPVEVDPEEMVRFAQERPVHMATYSVSDAVATFYLYEKYVHLFIFSLCTIIPMGPEDVLRKGSGTLCETLLMVQAAEKRIICPNKQVDPLAKFHNGHLLESETYIGGKVECLETGVYRSDVEYKFELKPSAFQGLIDNIDRDLTFAIEVEGGLDRAKITNYDEIRCQIVEQLELLRDRPNRVEKPYIYHLDVGAMYPNIILTNRLQPSAIVDDASCAACAFNQSKNDCKRKMNWVWRGDYNPSSKNEYDRTKDQLARENHDGQPFHALDEKEQANLVASRLKTYARNAYKKTKITEEETRKDTVCMRENDFYVDTVRQFRDRRYEYKKMTKSWKKKIGSAKDAPSKKEAEDKALVYDSLQVAHKCILNSFYGYVMRKGARWRSMEMAGIVTKNGADLITQARILVEQIGRPLELDTDGIWCILPKSFPDVYNFKTLDGSKFKLEYPCIMLNADVHDNFTNHQYQTLKDAEKGVYESRSECSIFFEVDGPYRCMVLPASTEEGKLLKKRYAVFNFDGSLAELKGFELKRRGELELIKTFQSQVFERFLDGHSLVECYDSVAEVANHWIDVLDTRGESLETDELVDLISENRSMSRQLEDYGDQKGTSQTTARRLGEFLGAEIIKDKGLNCKFIIAEKPYGAPVTERAIPTAIWKAEPAVMKHYLRKWLKSPGLEGEDFDIRNVLDWEYYADRLGKTIQKIITIPAALQKVANPVPRVPHPAWLHSKVRQLNDRFQQRSIRSMFAVKPGPNNASKSSDSSKAITLGDIEDFGKAGSVSKRPVVHSRNSRRTPTQGQECRTDSDATSSKVSADVHVQLSKESFSDWLKKKKTLWRDERKERRKRIRSSVGTGQQSTALSGQLAKKARVPVSSMEGYIRDAAIALHQREWQVIEVREMSSFDKNSSRASASGEFVLWIMIGGESLQKINVTVPRTVYVATKGEVTSDSPDIMAIKRVEKHLPHGKSSAFIYEITLSEYVYRTKNWTAALRPVKTSVISGDEYDAAIETVYETGCPLLLRALADMGCVLKLSPVASANSGASNKKSYSLTDLQRVNRPSEGEYLNRHMSYKRIFFYMSVNAKTKTGIVALFTMTGGTFGRGQQQCDSSGEIHDATRPELLQKDSFQMNASCNVWVVKPGSSRGQKNLSVKNCENLFAQLLDTIKGLSSEADAAGQSSEYSCISPESICQISSLKFVDRDHQAFTGANEVLNSYAQSNQGPTFLLLNSSKPLQYLRRAIPSFNSFPVVDLPFPPGPSHNPSLATLPSLNWEPTAVQLCMEAYFYMGVVSFPKRVSYARYGNVAIGNLGQDETVTLYDISFSRQLQKSRTISWASETPGRPDLGVSFLPGDYAADDTYGNLANQNEIWGDDDELISPVIRRPGAYRCVCVEIDVHDLAIAALTETASALPGAVMNQNGGNPTSPSSVAMFNTGSEGSDPLLKCTGPLGDEMSTAISLPMLRALVGAWLHDAYQSNSQVADDMLHNVYRLISIPEPFLNDPALHRMIHSLMKATFMRLLSELQRLGCKIVCATFNKIVVATNKTILSDAEEYVDFVIATIQSRSGAANSNPLLAGLSRIALRSSNYYSQYLFLDEYNFGGIQFERREIQEDEDVDWVIDEEGEEGPIVPTVVSGWSMMHYLGSDIAQEYFRIIVGRFSKDVLRKQMQLEERDGVSVSPAGAKEDGQIETYKKKLVSKHFANYLTRAVGEIENDGGGPESFPRLPGSYLNLSNPALEFIKSVMVVLELDTDAQKEVHVLKKSLLAQIGVQEYSSVAKWENPCASFILPDVYCSVCHECRDVNLCEISPSEGDNEMSQQVRWECDDCGTPYDAQDIERRLIDICNRKTIRYQLQDIRCVKTGKVATRAMSKQSDCSAELDLDIPRVQALSQLRIVNNLAEFHELEWLHETTQGLLKQFR